MFKNKKHIRIKYKWKKIDVRGLLKIWKLNLRKLEIGLKRRGGLVLGLVFRGGVGEVEGVGRWGQVREYVWEVCLRFVEEKIRRV